MANTAQSNQAAGGSAALALPPDYEPFETLHIAGSTFQRTRVLIKFGNIAPLLIGRGVYPLVWIRAPQPDGKDVVLVERNVVRHPAVSVELSEAGEAGPRSPKHPTVEIRLRAIERPVTLVRVYKESEEEAFVTDIDLRPLGILFFGGGDILNLGGSALHANTFSGSDVAVSIGA